MKNKRDMAVECCGYLGISGSDGKESDEYCIARRAHERNLAVKDPLLCAKFARKKLE
jgi:hypothetical protein